MSVQTHEEFLSQRRFAVLDGVRAVAVCLVFTAHPAYEGFWPIFHGPAGVTLFFALSGFLITTLLLREETKYGRVDLGAFYIRRLFRIYPVYILVFLIYVVLILVLGMQAERRDGFVENIPYYLLFFPEHSIAYNDWGYQIPFNGSWSIGIEEKFYFVWPVLGFLIMAAFRRARFVALMLLASFFTVMTFLGASALILAPYAPITYGALIAMLLHHRRTYELVSRLGHPAVLGVLALGMAAFHFSTDQILLGRPLYGVYGMGLALLLAGLVTTKTRAINWLSSRPLVYTGALSYVLYLIHNFGLNAAEMLIPAEWGLGGSILSTVLGIGAAFFVAAMIHRWFEEPLRLIGSRISHNRRKLRTVPAVARDQVARAEA